MENENEYQYFDPIEYFQPRVDAICSAMGCKPYRVTPERSLKPSAHEIVVSAMAGPTSRNTATVVYEVNVYCEKPNEAMSLLTELARTQTEKVFQSSVEGSDGEMAFYDIVTAYNLPTIIDKNIEMGSGHWCRVVQYVTFSVVADLLSVKSVKYNGQEIEFKQAVVSYAAETRPYPQSGQNLMKATPTGAAFTLSLILVPQNEPFSVAVKRVMYGLDAKGTSFPLEIKENDNIKVTKNFMLTGGTSTTTKGALPALQLSFMEKEG